jgi:hypothetical protein
VEFGVSDVHLALRAHQRILNLLEGSLRKAEEPLKFSWSEATKSFGRVGARRVGGGANLIAEPEIS